MDSYKDNILEKISYIKTQLEYLKTDLDEYKKIDLKDIKKKRWVMNSIKREAEEITESIIKINTAILKKNSRFPASYRNSFTELKDLGVCDEKSLIELSKTAIFRNELAHDYTNLTDDDIIRNSNKVLDLYPNFLIKVMDFISS